MASIQEVELPTDVDDLKSILEEWGAAVRVDRTPEKGITVTVTATDRTTRISQLVSGGCGRVLRRVVSLAFDYIDTFIMRLTLDSWSCLAWLLDESTKRSVNLYLGHDAMAPDVLKAFDALGGWYLVPIFGPVSLDMAVHETRLHKPPTSTGKIESSA